MNKSSPRPKFSVLMSIYHKENAQHFQEAMNSIWDNQTVKPNEIILVEDGPLTPELDAEIIRWQNKLTSALRIITLKSNVGTGKAKNIGLQKCNYKYIAIMDTDDLSVSTRFEMQLNYLEKHPEVVLIGGQIIEFEGRPENILSKKSVPLNQDEIITFAKKRSPFNHPATMYRRDVIQALGGYHHHLLMEDYNLWVRILAQGHKTKNLDQVLVFMRSRKAMLGRRRGLGYIKSEWQMMRLKQQLKFQNTGPALIIFILRSAPRLLPSSILNYVYRLLRGN